MKPMPMDCLLMCCLRGLNYSGQSMSIREIAVKTQPRKGAANEATRELLSEAFDIPLVLIEIISGHRSRQKSVRFREVTIASIESHLEAFDVE